MSTSPPCTGDATRGSGRAPVWTTGRFPFDAAYYPEHRLPGEAPPAAGALGRYLSAETAGSFAGRVVGVFAVEGDLLVNTVRYSGSDA